MSQKNGYGCTRQASPFCRSPVECGKKLDPGNRSGGQSLSTSTSPLGVLGSGNAGTIRGVSAVTEMTLDEKIASAGRLFGRVNIRASNDRVTIEWYDMDKPGRPVPHPSGGVATRDRYGLIGYEEAASYESAQDRIELLTGRRPRRRGSTSVTEPTPVKRTTYHRPDYSDPGARSGPFAPEPGVRSDEHLKLTLAYIGAGVLGPYDDVKLANVKPRDLIGTAGCMLLQAVMDKRMPGRILVPAEIDENLVAVARMLAIEVVVIAPPSAG